MHAGVQYLKLCPSAAVDVCALVCHAAQILDVIRGVLSMTVFAPTPTGGAHASTVRGVFGSLPGVTPQVLQSFEATYASAHSDKDQRGVIKQLLAAAGEKGCC